MQNKSDQQTDLVDLYERIKSDLIGYILSRLNWVKLTAYEKLALTSSHLGFVLMILLICVCMFILGVLTLGLFLGECLGSHAAGFGIMVLSLAIILLIFILAGKPIRKGIANLAVTIIKKVEENEE